MTDEKNLTDTPEYKLWRGEFLHYFEGALYDSLREERSKLGGWKSPNHLFLILRSSIMGAYSSTAQIHEVLVRTKDPTDSELDDAMNSRKEVLESLVYSRLEGWHRSVLWSCVAAYNGTYESVARELRFVIEDSAQALHADLENREDSIEVKIEWLESNRLRGSKLIDETQLPLDMKEMMKVLYWELCDYVHPSVELLRTDLNSENRVYFEYIADRFDQCLNLHRKTFDLVLALIMFRFPAAIDRFLKEYDGEEQLRAYGFNEALKMCQSLSEDENYSIM